MKAIVTGAAQGLGRAITKQLIGEKYFVYALDLDSTALKSLETECPDSVKGIVCDITDPVSVRGALEPLKNEDIQVLVNNAGYLRARKFVEDELETIQKHIDVNLKGLINVTHIALKIHSLTKIVNIGSLAGITPTPGQSSYTASKFAVRGLSLALHHELKASGISVTCLAPGTIEGTPMTERFMGDSKRSVAYLNPPLSQSAVLRAFQRALETKKPEILVSSGQGCLAKLAMLFPNILMKHFNLFEATATKKSAE